MSTQIGPVARTTSPSSDLDSQTATERSDPVYETVTELVNAVAGALGLDVSTLEIDSTEEGGRRLRAQGAGGSSSGRRISVDPDLVNRPHTLKHVVAHETVHVAQRNYGGRPSGTLAFDVTTAEAEAELLARRWVEGRTLTRPIATLPTGYEAADQGWAERSAFVHDLVALVALVEDAYPNEWNTLLEAVNEHNTIERRHLDRVIDTLAGLPSPIARAMVRKLNSPATLSLVNQLSPEHYGVYRSTVIAILSAMTRAESRRIGVEAWEQLDLTGLDTLDHDLLLVAAANAPHEVISELLEAESGDDESNRAWHDLLSGNTISTPSETLDDLISNTEARVERRAVDRTAAVAELRAQVDEHLEAERWVEAVNTIAEHEDEEVRRAVVEALDAENRVEPLLSELDDDTSASAPAATQNFRTFMAARPTAANLATIRDRLSGGIFGWDWTEDIAITEGDAIVAFAAIEALPLATRETLLRSSDHGALNRDDPGDLLDRMERNLPRWFITDGPYRSLAVDRDGSGERVERGGGETWNDPALRALFNRILIHLDAERYGAAFNAIATGWVGDENVEPEDETDAQRELLEHRVDMTLQHRQQLVDRLDALDRMDELLERLPGSIRRTRSRRLELLEVCSARSVPNLLRHLHDLLPGFLHGLPDELAELAFVLFRALPAHERPRFSRLGEITERLSPEVTTWSGTNLLDAATSREQLDWVRARLADGDLWTTRRRGELRTMVGLAFALGDGATVRRRAREFEALTHRGLREIVHDFRLDRETNGVDDLLGVGRLANPIGLGWAWMGIRDMFSGDLVVAGNGFRHDDLDLEEIGRLSGGTISGARFAPREADDGGDDRQVISPDGNRAQVSYNERSGRLEVTLPELVLSGVGYPSTGWAVNVGTVRVSGLSMVATFETGNLRYPRHIDLDTTTVDLQDLLFTTNNSRYAAARIHLDGFEAEAQPSLDATNTGTDRQWWTYIPIFGPLIHGVRGLIRALSLAVNGAGQLSQGAQELRNVELRMDGATIDGLLFGETPVEQVTLGPTMIGWGGTRAAYLDQQQRLLQTRIQRLENEDDERSAEERSRLQSQLDGVSAELESVRDEDEELDRLIRRQQRDPDSLTADDHRRVADLQRGPGGFVIDTGTVRIDGIGDVAERAVLQRISGAMEAHAGTGGRLTDQALATQFLNGGPPSNSTNQLSGRGRIDVGDIHVIGRPPTEATLVEWRDAAVAAGGESRAAEINLAIEIRQQLDALRRQQENRLRAGLDPDPTLAAEIEARLRNLATQVNIEGGYLEADTDSGVVEFGASRAHGTALETSKFSSSYFDLHGIRAPLTLRPDVLRSGVLRPLMAGDFSPSLGLAADLVQSGSLSVESGEFVGNRFGAGDNEVGRIGFSGFTTGTVARFEEGDRRGFTVTGFHIDTLSGRDSDVRYGAHHIQSRGTVQADGIHADFRIELNEDNSVSRIVVVNGRIDAIIPVGTPDENADPEFHNAPLIYTNSERGIQARFTGGALRGLAVSNLVYDMSAGLTEAESITLDQIDALELGVAMAGYDVTTTLGSPATNNVAVSAALAEDGMWSADLLNIAATDTTVTSPDGHVRIERAELAHLGGRYDGQNLYIDRVVVPLVRIGELQWQIKGGTLSSSGPTEVRDIRIEQTATYDTERSRFVMPSLTIGSVVAPDLRYQRGPLDIRVTDLAIDQPGEPGAHGVELTDVTWQRGTQTSFAAAVDNIRAHVDAGSSATPGAALLDRDWGFIGDLSAAGLTVEQFGTGRLVAGVEDLDVEGQAHVAGLLDTDVNVTDASLGQIEIDGNTITIPPGAANRLNIGEIALNNFALTSSLVDIRTEPGASLRLENLGVGLTIEMADVVPGGEGEIDPDNLESVFSSVTIHEVELPRVATDGLILVVKWHGDEYHVTLSSGSGGADSEISGIRAHDLFLDLDYRGGSYEVIGWSYRDVEIDHINLHDIDFDVPITSIVGGDTPTGTASPPLTLPLGHEAWVQAFEPLLNELDGHVDADLTVPIYDTYAGIDWGDRIVVDIDITNGQVNFVELESQLLEHMNIADMLIDFEVKGNRLVLELDYSDIGIAGGVLLGGAGGLVLGGGAAAGVGGGLLGGGAGGGIGALLSDDLVEWTLTPGDQARASRDRVRLSRLLIPDGGSIFSGAGGSSPIEVDFQNLTLASLAMDLSVTNSSAERITLPDSMGEIVFAPNALDGFSVTAGPIGARPVFGAPALRAAINFAVDALDLASMDLKLSIGNLHTGAVRLRDVTDGHINLARMGHPGSGMNVGLGVFLDNITGSAGRFEIEDLRLTP